MDCKNAIILKTNKNESNWCVVANKLAVIICNNGMKTYPKKIDSPLKGSREVAISIPKY